MRMRKALVSLVVLAASMGNALQAFALEFEVEVPKTPRFESLAGSFGKPGLQGKRPGADRVAKEPPPKDQDLIAGLSECWIIDDRLHNEELPLQGWAPSPRRVIEILAPCFKQMSAKTGVTITAEETAVRFEHWAEQSPSVSGIGLRVTGPPELVSRVKDDIQRALKARHWNLVTHPARLLPEG